MGFEAIRDVAARSTASGLLVGQVARLISFVLTCYNAVSGTRAIRGSVLGFGDNRFLGRCRGRDM